MSSSSGPAQARGGAALASRAGGSRRKRALRLLAGACLAALACTASAEGLDLRALRVVPQHGQSADQARRDRYECHVWAVQQTGVIPKALPRQGAQRRHPDQGRRIARVIHDTIVGAGLGGLIRALQDKDPDRGVLAGAAVGAAIGAAKSRPRRSNQHGTRLDPASRNYLRALSACLEGRGYKVVLPARRAGGRRQRRPLAD